MLPFKPSLIAAFDIGSPMTGGLAWAALENEKTGPNEQTGCDIQELVALVASALGTGPVALGFEAPLWVPMRSDPMTVTKARQGEGSRPWSAAAGASVLATGLAVIPNILTAIRRVAGHATVALDFHNPPDRPGALLFWEAFVSARDKGDSHEDDAVIAARAFQHACSNLSSTPNLTPEPCLNLLGAMLLRTGWSSNLSLLEAETLVVRV